jgi:sporulation protein YlmC with PRC-barrel domain
MRTLPVAAVLAMMMIAGAGLAMAQSAPGGTQSAGTQPGAGRSCVQKLRAFGQAMNQDGYWLSGWQPHRAAPAGPWGDVNWPASPGGQLRTLYAAAHILALRGEEQTCAAVLEEARQIYARSVADLHTHGVQTSTVRDYRRRQIADALPVGRMNTACRLASVMGTDVRNGGDEYLGPVEDVVVDPSTGRPSYVLIGTGGFLGIGQDYVAVPWQALKATPGFGILVLGVEQGTLDKAPKVDPNDFVGTESSRQQQKVDAYWKQHGGQG